MDYASKDIYNFKEFITRYDHSLSVALLTWKLTKDKKATLAGLFHDVATPCFSHVIDYMNKDYTNQESTEEYTNKILQNDKLLVKLLQEDNIKLEEIADFKKYSIVDNDRPKLCADRLDGIILTGASWTQNLNSKEIKEFIDDIIIIENELKEKEIGFKTKNIAKKVLETSKLIDTFCHTKEDNYMMELLATITKLAIENNLFKYDDLYILEEKEILNRLENANNNKIIELFDKFKNIKKEDIPFIKLDGVKIRDLNPLVNNKRLKERKAVK